MRETRQSGSEGGARFKPSSLPLYRRVRSGDGRSVRGMDRSEIGAFYLWVREDIGRDGT